MSNDKAAAFAGTLAEFYDRYLVPLMFAPYSEVVADRAKDLHPRHVLETAAGTGIVTEALVRTLPPDVTITATDLNQAMIERGKMKPGTARVTWQQSDAMKLPFSDSTFDLIVCQFGVMFFADKRASFRECFRLLPADGTHLFVVWDNYDSMPDAPLWIATQVVANMLQRDPHTLLSPGYFDETTIRADLAATGFREPSIDRITCPARAASAAEAAMITVQGSLLRSAIEAADPTRLDAATKAVERVLLDRFGDGPIEGATRALIVTASKPE